MNILYFFKIIINYTLSFSLCTLILLSFYVITTFLFIPCRIMYFKKYKLDKYDL